MFLARVVGEVVATTKHAALVGQRLMLVRPVDPAGVPSDPGACHARRFIGHILSFGRVIKVTPQTRAL